MTAIIDRPIEIIEGHERESGTPDVAETMSLPRASRRAELEARVMERQYQLDECEANRGRIRYEREFQASLPLYSRHCGSSIAEREELADAEVEEAKANLRKAQRELEEHDALYR